MKTMPLEDKIGKTADRLLQLDPGSLAELRRMGTGGAGPLAFWRLAAECGFLDDPSELWRPVVQIFAILTPRGDRLATDRLHDARRRLGAVLCDGGDPGWPGDREPRPFLSETRLGRLLAAPAEQRGDAWTRIARMLAAHRDRASGLDCYEIATSILFPDAKRGLQKIAQAYYRRLDAATRKSEREEAQV
jgi:CRISPR system Cascade subunit CasB